MRRSLLSTKLEYMETLISLCPLIVALIPLGMALRALLTDAVHDGNGSPSTFPSLETLSELENTAPTFVKQMEWWTIAPSTPSGGPGKAQAPHRVLSRPQSPAPGAPDCGSRPGDRRRERSTESS
jgi:hypothetical protein